MWKYNIYKEWKIGMGDNPIVFRNGSTMTVQWDATFGNPNRIRGNSEQLYIEGNWAPEVIRPSDISIWDRIDDRFQNAISYILEHRVPIDSNDASIIFTDCCRGIESDYGTQGGIRSTTFSISEDPVMNMTNIDWYIRRIQDGIDVPYSRRIQISDEMQERGINRVPVYRMGSREPIRYVRTR